MLAFAGIEPIAETRIGGIDALDDAGRARWLARLHEIGRGGC